MWDGDACVRACVRILCECVCVKVFTDVMLNNQQVYACVHVCVCVCVYFVVHVYIFISQGLAFISYLFMKILNINNIKFYQIFLNFLVRQFYDTSMCGWCVSVSASVCGGRGGCW